MTNQELPTQQPGQPPNSAGAIADAARRGTRATLFGILASVFLAAVKIAAGLLGNAYVLIADGVESTLDIFSSLVVMGSLRVASQPPSERFHYGYGKAEPLGSMVVSIVLLGAGLGIAFESIREIMTPHSLPQPFTLAVLVGVVITKEVMFRKLTATGGEIGSQSMETDAWHHRSDAITSVAAFIGISIALIEGEGYEDADDWAALFACAIITYNGIRLFRQSLEQVLDVAPPPEVEQRIRELAESVPESCKPRSATFDAAAWACSSIYISKWMATCRCAAGTGSATT